MSFLYRLYQILVLLPVLLISTIITAVVTTIGCRLGNHRRWGYIPGRIWSKVMIRTALLPITVEGRENIKQGESYVFCANHQGAYDIFMIYGYLGCNFKWMLKASLRKIPFVGRACEEAGFIFVDNSTNSKTKQTIEQAREVLQDGMSLVLFPEGRRTEDGRMGVYKRGAFFLADELQLPVIPITINGSFDVLPRQKGFYFLHRKALRLTIHKPIYPDTKGAKNIITMAQKSREITHSALEEQYR